jgi:hypothetical protein
MDAAALAFEVGRIKKRLARAKDMARGLMTRADRLKEMGEVEYIGGLVAGLVGRLPHDLYGSRYIDLIEALADEYLVEYSEGSEELQERRKWESRKSMRADVFKLKSKLGPFVGAYAVLTKTPPSCYRDHTQESERRRGGFYDFMQALAPHVGLDPADVNTLALRFSKRKA